MAKNPCWSIAVHIVCHAETALFRKKRKEKKRLRLFALIKEKPDNEIHWASL